MYGYIYKITNDFDDKVYIGQTTRTVEIRFNEHMLHSTAEDRKALHLYAAMNKYGKEHFKVEQIDTAINQEDLNNKEKYWIKYYNSIETGYNILEGGNDANPMYSKEAKQKHDDKMRSKEVRNKISIAMQKFRAEHGFSDEHRKKISEAQRDRKCFFKDGKRTYTAGKNIAKINQLLNDGWVLYVKAQPQHKTQSQHKTKKTVKSDGTSIFATRSKAVYCILDTGERKDFDSILHAGEWWYEEFKPFGEIYSTATYQRKIEASIAGKDIEYGCKTHKKYRKITNIKWYYVV